MGKKIYGVDVSKKVTPLMVRNAIIRCFISAHEEVLDEIKSYSDFDSEKKFEEMKKINIEYLIKSIFGDIGADYNKPKKKDLIKVIDALADYSKHFRDKKIIKKHYNEIMTLIEKIK